MDGDLSEADWKPSDLLRHLSQTLLLITYEVTLCHHGTSQSLQIHCIHVNGEAMNRMVENAGADTGEFNHSLLTKVQ